MVALETVRESNRRAAASLPPGLVAVFAGATSGIGEYSLKAFAKHTSRPRIYFIGRSREAGDRILGELEADNPEGEYVFISADVSLMKNVDEVCADLKRRERWINVLFMSQGTVNLNAGDTAEGLRYAQAVTYYSRARFLANLLPLVSAAPVLRRVVSSCVGTKEGPLDLSDLGGRRMSLLNLRDRLASTITLTHMVYAQRYPTVSLIHNFPGSVRTNLVRGGEGFVVAAMAWFLKTRMSEWVLGPPMSPEECGERHAFLCTSARFPARTVGEAGGQQPPSQQGVEALEGVAVARGLDGVVGSGAYSIDGQGDDADDEVIAFLERCRSEGLAAKVTEHTEGEFVRITGSVAI